MFVLKLSGIQKILLVENCKIFKPTGVSIYICVLCKSFPIISLPLKIWLEKKQFFVSYLHCSEDGLEGSWSPLTRIPHVECCNFGCAVLQNQLYVVGGCFNQDLQENIHPFGFRYCARYKVVLRK